MKKINVRLNNKNNYDILIKFKLFKYLKKFPIINKENKLMIITNEYLYNKYFEYVFNSLNKCNLKYNYFLVKDGESSKCFKTVNEIITVLLNYKYDRNSILIAFGGGVIGDITGFVASIYLRGIKYINIPTTLLSQIDSSIGGKTGINHALGKNMIGSFYQPSLVLIDINLLETLTKREILSGISEIIKYSIILNYSLFLWLENNLEKLIELKKEKLLYCIYKCCKLKSNIIIKDEKENGIRSILNFGHTFGHAIETFMGYGNWTHGEAISSGMIIASKLSFYLNNIDNISFDRIKNLILKSGLPISGPSSMNINDYINIITIDKKNYNEEINIIIPTKIGKGKILKNTELEIIKKSISFCKNLKK